MNYKYVWFLWRIENTLYPLLFILCKTVVDLQGLNWFMLIFFILEHKNI